VFGLSQGRKGGNEFVTHLFYHGISYSETPVDWFKLILLTASITTTIHTPLAIGIPEVINFSDVGVSGFMDF
jgi:hypothetical protein